MSGRYDIKRLIIAVAFGAGLLGGATIGGSDALAKGRGDERAYDDDRGDRDHRYEHKKWRRNDYGGRHDYRFYRDRPHDRHRPRYGYGHRHGSLFGFFFRPYPPARPPALAVRPCHATSKTSYDDYGRRAVIGGVMCYDGYGNPYIVQGSRRVIRYY